MQFVIQVAMNGRFSSRHMRQVVNDVTARAVTAFAATGGDPHRFDVKVNDSAVISVHIQIINPLFLEQSIQATHSKSWCTVQLLNLLSVS